MTLVKLIAFSTAGVSGTLGAFSPLMHIGVTSPSWETKWHKRVDFSEPILKNCKPRENNNADTDYGNKLYSVFLDYNEGGANNAGLDSSEIFLKVEETTLSRGVKEKEIIWKQGIEKQEDNWEIWKIQHKDNKVDFSYPYWNKWFKRVEFGLTDCEERMIEPSSFTGFGSGVPVVSKEIKLTVNKGDQCRKYFGSAECDINIDTQGKLKWKDGFQPKIIYKAF